jgi:hypothetical protein
VALIRLDHNSSSRVAIQANRFPGMLDLPLDRLRFCSVLVNLFLLGSELLLRGGGGRWFSLSDRRWLRWRILQRHLTDRRNAGLLFGNGDVVRRLRGRYTLRLPDKRGCDTDQSRCEKVSQSEECSPVNRRPVARQLIASRYEKVSQS